MDDGHRIGKPPFSSTEGLLLIAGFSAVAAFFIVIMVLASKLNPSTSLPSLSIIGIALLLICLAAISYVFVRVNLQDRTQALGLPQGSIQAVIALSLIVLFAILSIFIFASMGESSLRRLSGLDEAGRKEQVEKLGSSFAGWEKAPEGTYTIYVRDPGIEARNDVGKQLIVLIGTLMTSAVSFYFGSRATLAGSNPATDGDGGQGSAATIRETTPTEMPIGGTTRVTIKGTGLAKTTAVAFRQEGTEPLKTTVTSATDTEVVCSVEVPPDAAEGDYDAVLTVGGATVMKAAALKLVG